MEEESLNPQMVSRVFRVPEFISFHLTPDRMNEYTGFRDIDEEQGRKDAVEYIYDVYNFFRALFKSVPSENEKSKEKVVEKQNLLNTGKVDFFKESLKTDQKRPRKAFYIKDNGVDDQDALDDAGNDRSSLDPQLKLQKYFRQAFEYRMVNSMEASRLAIYADFIAAAALSLSAILSILLLSGQDDTLITVAALLSAIVTFLTGYSSYMGFAVRYEKHTTASTKFATVQRNIYNVLQTESDSGIAKKLTQLTSDFNSAREVMPIVDNDILTSYLDEENRALFPDIMEEMTWNESVEAIQDMSEMGLTTKTKLDPEKNKLHIETMVRKRRKFTKLNRLKVQPRKRIVEFKNM